MKAVASFVAASLAVFLVTAGPAQMAQAQSPQGNGQPPAPSVSASAQTTQPAIGPAPSWVTPVGLPSAPTASGDDAPVRFLLQDQQVMLEEGHQTTYSEVALRIQSPAGLAVGNISLPWRPETDVLTVHKMQILRGDQSIDILESGQTFIVLRREQNLESAMLDGVLTANIQPEGLQVGDVLVLATSTTTTDPVVGAHVEQIGAGWNIAPVSRAHLSVQWPQSMHIDYRLSSPLPVVRPTRRGGMVKFELSMDHVEPVPAPRGAPARYSIGRLAEFTSFRSWAELAALMAPLYEQAATLPSTGPLVDEVERIRNASPDPVARAQAALALVQDRIRYVALAMGVGGLVPADAQTTWGRRFGDCKGKTALLIAILRALEIEAEPVAVSHFFGDGLDQRLPMIGLFDHVLVRVAINGKTYFLDGTRIGDTRLERIDVPAFGWGLPLTAQGATLVRMWPEPAATPEQVTSMRIDASAGLMAPAPVHVEYTIRGDAAVASNIAYSSLSAEARDRSLREYWRQQYRDLDVTAVGVTFDAQAREQRLVMDGRFNIDFSRGRYRAQEADIGYRADFRREPGPQSDAPFAVMHPVYRQVITTIVLPVGQTGFRVDGGEDVNQTVAGVIYSRRARIDGNNFVVEASERSIASEFPAAEAPAAQAALRALANRGVYLVRPVNYRATPDDLRSQSSITPTDASGFLRRGNIYLDSGRVDEALADFNRAVELEPQNPWALANRGIARVWRGDNEAAARDLAAATVIDPNNIVVFRARGLMAQNTGAHSEAIAAYSRALAIEPGDGFSLGRRAQAHFSMRDYDGALADSAAALQSRPLETDLYLLRANIHIIRGDPTRAAAEADKLAQVAEDAYGHVVAAQIYAVAGRQERAMSEFDRAIAAGPEAYIYLSRAVVRPSSDIAGRREDIDEALRLAPGMRDALVLRAELLEGQGDYQGAVAAWTDALRGAPNDVHLRASRGAGYAMMGREALASADFVAARAQANSASELNSVCWAKATANTALQSALDDCDAALALSPDSAAIIDSRAFVLLRLGRLDDAISEYDRALAIEPHLAASLFGRGLAWERKGDQARAEADITAAIQIAPDIHATFEGYGLTARTPSRR